MKLSPSTIAANLSAAAAAEAEANAANSNSTNNASSTNTTTNTNLNTTTSMLSSNYTITKPMNQTAASKLTPKDTQVIAAVLKEMGITEYEPRVLPQLVEFAYRYASRVLDDAQLFSSYAKKKVIDTDDVSIAIQMQVDRSFVGPPSRDILLEIARNKNNQPLPPIKSHNGMRLPADRYSLVAPNLRLISSNNTTTQQSKPPSYRTGTSLLSNNSIVNCNSFVNSKISIATVNTKNVAQLSSNTFESGTKRKLEP